MTLWTSLKGQFTSLPYPNEDCSGRTVIITGANIGLGLEASRHFVRLNAARVILACRNVEKGEAARADIETSTQRKGVVEVWQVDLASFESVKGFAARVNKLDRVDIFINNASILNLAREEAEGHELQITVNVISTLLLSILVLPVLRRTAKQFNVTPHMPIVSSVAACLTFFQERNADRIIEALDAQKVIPDRYNESKLLQVMIVKRLAAAVDASGKGHVLINSLNPGLCQTTLFRQFFFPLNVGWWILSRLIARSAEVGSRTLMHAAFAGEESHGNWMWDCKPYACPPIMEGEEGEKLTGRVWDELLEIVERIEPGVTQLI